ncbi:MAG: nucleotidyltransferase domain-containing protein [Myxococcales bacterium]|nr:nucleotidyltransferase domain-containing protein [Myxococcales bacterium]
MSAAARTRAPPMGALRRRIAGALAGDPDFQLAILFGSAATGRLRPDSDIDIALGTRRARSLPDRRLLRLQAELSQAAGREVQLVLLFGAPLSLRFAVARDGKLLWARERGAPGLPGTGGGGRKWLILPSSLGNWRVPEDISRGPSNAC